jgi:lysophospholipase L1-like esterase
MADFRFREDEIDWDRPQREVQNQAAGTPVLDLLPAFRARADRAQLYLREDTHFAALGHQAAADQLAQFLQSGGWLPRRSP